MSEVIEADWVWTQDFDNHVTPDGEPFTPEMDDAAIVGRIEATTCDIYRLVRRTGELTIEIEDIVVSGSAVVQYHDGPVDVHANPEESYVEIIEGRFLENANDAVADAMEQI